MDENVTDTTGESFRQLSHAVQEIDNGTNCVILSQIMVEVDCFDYLAIVGDVVCPCLADECDSFVGVSRIPDICGGINVKRSFVINHDDHSETLSSLMILLLPKFSVNSAASISFDVFGQFVELCCHGSPWEFGHKKSQGTIPVSWNNSLTTGTRSVVVGSFTP